MRSICSFHVVAGLAVFGSCAFAVDPPPPVITNLTAKGAQRGVQFPPYPGAQSYSFLSASNAPGPYVTDTGFFLVGFTNVITNGVTLVTNVGYEWRKTNVTASSGYFRVGATPMNPDVLLAAQVLNRLAYGPTPDEWERVLAMGATNYIAEQLNMQGIPETLDNYITETTNTAPAILGTNWTYVKVTGTQSSTNLLMYMTQMGDVYIDDIQLVVGTNVANPNLLVNGDFESPGLAPWTNAGNHVGSAIVSGISHSGSSSLHVVCTAPGSSQGTSIWQPFVSTQTNGANSTLTLSYWVLPNPKSSKLTLRLSTASGNYIYSSAAGLPPTPTWAYAKATGNASALSRLYFYLSGNGECYVDDIKLVAGTVAESGVNLVQNGDFESALAGTWNFQSNYTNSVISSNFSHSGNGSLRVIASSGGGTNNGIYQTISPSLVNGQTYTVSYWYLPATPTRTLTARLFGFGPTNLLSTPDADIPGLKRRLGTIGQASLADLRAWFCMRAVRSPRQLFEILSQFWENHFVTQHAKSRDYFLNRGYPDGNYADRLAAEWEFRELTKWRNAMLNPQCTFYDLLRISAESPAMIVYLDTVDSKGNGNNTANENWARELLELFTFGVDNGYDQTDIVRMSRAWTGWSVELVDPENAGNVFAPASLTYYPGTNGNAKANAIGVWALNYKSGNHGTNRGKLFEGKTVPARFGPPWAGQGYQVTIPGRTGTNSILDGYDVITNLANLPFTQEFISVKLCRLFVHDGFPNPTTDPSLPEYAFYDYTNPNRSMEAELVHQCMLAWDTSNPKGQIRAVLNTIFSSDLFRSQYAALQKIKTPFEFVASSVRALYSPNPDGTATASTDGYSFAIPHDRFGTMGLFDRPAPDGYPEAGPPWLSAGTLADRIRFVQSFSIAPGQTGHVITSAQSSTNNDAGLNLSDPVALVKKKLPSGSWNNAAAVADYFLGYLFVADGAANLALSREACIRFLDTDDAGAPSAFLGLNNTQSPYDNRVRGMVAMLLSSQRFHEQ